MVELASGGPWSRLRHLQAGVGPMATSMEGACGFTGVTADQLAVDGGQADGAERQKARAQRRATSSMTNKSHQA